MYLNLYVPHLQTVGATVGYLHVQHGQRFASTTAVAPMTDAFDAANANLPLARSIRAAEAALNTWHDKANLAA